MLITSLIRIYLLLSRNIFNHLASTPELKLYGFHTDENELHNKNMMLSTQKFAALLLHAFSVFSV